MHFLRLRSYVSPFPFRAIILFYCHDSYVFVMTRSVYLMRCVGGLKEVVSKKE